MFVHFCCLLEWDRFVLNPDNFFTHRYRLYLLCEHTANPANWHIVTEDAGYEIKHRKQFMAKHAKMVGLCMNVIGTILSASSFTSAVGALFSTGIAHCLPAFFFTHCVCRSALTPWRVWRLWLSRVVSAKLAEYDIESTFNCVRAIANEFDACKTDPPKATNKANSSDNTASPSSVVTSIQLEGSELRYFSEALLELDPKKRFASLQRIVIAQDEHLIFDDQHANGVAPNQAFIRRKGEICYLCPHHAQLYEKQITSLESMANGSSSINFNSAPQNAQKYVLNKEINVKHPDHVAQATPSVGDSKTSHSTITTSHQTTELTSASEATTALLSAAVVAPKQVNIDADSAKSSASNKTHFTAAAATTETKSQGSSCCSIM